ncbi:MULTISPECIES: PilN domain-containing protein [Cysteiniphilum]|uniref:PilN domain-containing protein n=1 Tax=Cysteiniphilum TaxID=2056696 RepID=UPI00178004E8|nr:MULTISPECIES: PilN domain-containing protein [Cysteiniphilum]
MHNFNLLPWREMRQKKHLKSLALDFGFVVLVGVVITFIWLIIASKGLSNQYARNEYLRTQNVDFLKNNAELVKLEKEKLELIRKIELLNNLEKERQKVLGVWFGLSQTLPDTAYLISIEKNKNELLLEGRAENSKAVAQFMRALEDSPEFDRPTLANISLIGKPGFGAENAFKISVKQEVTK